jgi:hypothetical protein
LVDQKEWDELLQTDDPIPIVFVKTNDPWDNTNKTQIANRFHIPGTSCLLYECQDIAAYDRGTLYGYQERITHKRLFFALRSSSERIMLELLLKTHGWIFALEPSFKRSRDVWEDAMAYAKDKLEKNPTLEIRERTMKAWGVAKGFYDEVGRLCWS